MGDSFSEIIEAIRRERAYQDRKWGVKPHTVGNFLLILEGELEEAKQGWRKGIGDADALREILQVIAVGVACLEQHGLVERTQKALATNTTSKTFSRENLERG